jgi:hypothetical protein
LGGEKLQRVGRRREREPGADEHEGLVKELLHLRR